MSLTIAPAMIGLILEGEKIGKFEEWGSHARSLEVY